MSGPLHRGEGVEIGRCAVDRLEVGLVELAYPDGIADGARLVGEREEQHVDRVDVADRKQEVGLVGVAVEDHRVGPSLWHGAHREGVCQGGHRACQHIPAVDRAVERTVKRRASADEQQL